MKKLIKKTRYQSDLIGRLKDTEFAAEYLKAAIEEEDAPEVFLLALRNIAEAHGIGSISQSTELNRENLYKMLSKRGNPTIRSLCAILKSLGMRFSIEPIGAKVSNR
jgi:probable addiction module antidote protein